jgi:NAD(P)-dependent dehydrogenase (short-subunit alcohol dehydrogenase family)
LGPLHRFSGVSVALVPSLLAGMMRYDQESMGGTHMPGEFEDKVVVVSGASRGIGRGIALAFAREGAQTVLASSSEQNLAAAAEAIAAEGRQPLTVAGDLRRLDACEQLFRRVSERFGRCDVLVNNAGATRAGNFMELPDEAWLDGFALKFFGGVRLTRLFWPLLKASEGHVVNIIGGAARTVEPEFLIGGSVNAAAANFTKGLSRLGMRDGVHVNSIHPGMTATERTEQLLVQRAAAQGRPVEELRAAALARSGTRRMGTPEDIAALTLFLCSERARHIQGTAVAVDGGATPGVY